jgi:hypothetical protein
MHQVAKVLSLPLLLQWNQAPEAGIMIVSGASATYGRSADHWMWCQEVTMHRHIEGVNITATL